MTGILLIPNHAFFCKTLIRQLYPNEDIRKADEYLVNLLCAWSLAELVDVFKIVRLCFLPLNAEEKLLY